MPRKQAIKTSAAVATTVRRVVTRRTRAELSETPSSPSSSSSSSSSSFSSSSLVGSDPPVGATEFEINALLRSVVQAFDGARNDAYAPGMAKYMKNHFSFLGLQKPIRAQLQQDFMSSLKTHPKLNREDIEDLVQSLWQKPEREYQYLAMDIMDQFIKRKNPIYPSLSMVENLIRTKSWWDTIDTISSKVVGPIVMTNRASFSVVMDRWIRDENMWIRRAAILHQLSYKSQLDSDRLFRYIEATMHEEEFFVRKAIGWSLRQYSKTNKDEVRVFVERNKEGLSSLSYREATKYI